MNGFRGQGESHCAGCFARRARTAKSQEVALVERTSRLVAFFDSNQNRLILDDLGGINLA